MTKRGARLFFYLITLIFDYFNQPTELTDPTGSLKQTILSFSMQIIPPKSF